MTIPKNPKRLAQIKELASQGKYLTQIAREVECTVQTVLQYEKMYNLTIPRHPKSKHIRNSPTAKPWTEDEEHYIIYAMEDSTVLYREVAEELGRTERAVANKVSDLKRRGFLPDRTGKYWTDDEIRYLIHRYRYLPTEDIAQHLKRSIGSVIHKAINLGLSKPKDRTLLNKIKALADEGYYLNQIARKLRIGHSAVIYYENAYGFKVPRESPEAKAEREKQNRKRFWNRQPVHYTGKY